ncbi:flagellar export protein FliJ [Limisalsivibrio acetivorans]|uniref:flagellar export protein FliJ n=1 Tax=Limisalsivibrio acetivorans TaxID=1304888 RepID=UPI0003B5DB95|nr:flagellar export protein FliJ [Limisalsivibrio acetivorans]
MKREFKLQKVLEHRERIVDLEKSKLSELRAKQRSVQEQLEGMNRTILEKMSELEGVKQRGEFPFIKMYDDFLRKLQYHRRNLERTLRDAERAVEKQKAKVVQSMNDHKVMLKLKEKHDKEYIDYLNKEEMKMIDDLMVSRQRMNDE